MSECGGHPDVLWRSVLSVFSLFQLPGFQGHFSRNPTSDSWDCNALKFSGFSIINTQACMLSHFSRVQLFATPPGFLCPWNSPGKNTWVDCHALLQGIFLTQGSNLFVLQFLHCRWIRHCRVSGEPINIQCRSVKSPILPGLPRWSGGEDSELPMQGGAGLIPGQGTRNLHHTLGGQKYILKINKKPWYCHY